MKLHELQQQFMKTIIDGVDLAPRLHIYHESSLNGRLKALQHVFPCTVAIVGEVFFRQMTIEFLTLEPSQHLTADAQGQNFPAFISTYNPAKSLPYLTDLAKLEWLWYCVFHDVNQVQFIESTYPITQLWEMSQPEYRGDFVLQELSEPLKVMLFQREHRIHMLHLTQEQWDINRKQFMRG
jgi:Putative DNA-binding domain